MPQNFNGLPFDAELFQHQYEVAADKELTAIVDSGALVPNGNIANLISTGSDTYTIPFYNVLSGAGSNYDGSTNIVAGAITAATQSGVVFGRSYSWSAQDFAADITGNDPMKAIATQVGTFVRKRRQAQLLLILNAIFGAKSKNVTELDTEFKTGHVLETGAPISSTDVIDATVEALGDASDDISLVIMHSHIAASLKKQKVLEFIKYTDSNGFEKPTKLATWDGKLVVIDDACPVETAVAGGEAPEEAITGGAKVYTTYLFASGSVLTADAGVKVPTEVHRDPNRNGGEEQLIVRERLTLHPNGFTFVKPTGYTTSPTDEQLSDANNWTVSVDPKAIGIVALKTLR